MKKFSKRLLTIAMAALLILNVSCNNDKEAAPSVKGSNVLVVRTVGSSGESTDYIVQAESLDTGTISTVGNGIEQKSWRAYEATGNKLFSFTYQNDNIVPTYKLDQTGKLAEQGKFSIGRLHLICPVDESTIVGMNIPRNGTALATFYQIDANEMAIKKEATTDVIKLVNNGEQAYFSHLLVKGDKLYASFFQIANSSFASNHTDSAYVAIYSYPGFELQKVIRDNRTGPIGIYYGSSGIFNTENGDLYTVSTTAMASGYSRATRPSGILRIKNGTTEFDANYFFNIEEATGGYKIAFAEYVGNGKILAQIYIFKDHTEADKWTNRDVRLAVVDLNTKSVKYIENVPLHTGGSYKIHNIRDNGSIYVKINSPAEGIYIYKVDIANTTATKGAKVEGAEVVGMYKLLQEEQQ